MCSQPVDISTCSLCCSKVKSNLEKAKQALEKETSELHIEIRSLGQSKQDVEHKKKKLEGQLGDLQSRYNEGERQRAELTDRVSKITVSSGLKQLTNVTHWYTINFDTYHLNVMQQR